jgi:hypothetical protein
MEGPGAGSVSRVGFTAAVRGRGEAKLAMFRHLSPLTLNALMRDVPIHSRVNAQPGMVCLFTNLRVGVEKGRTNFQKGEIAFHAAANLVCIFTKAVKSDRPLNPLGKVEAGIDLLENLKSGDVVTLSLEPKA